MLGVHKPMILREKMHRTFRQILTFAKIHICPFCKNLLQILPSVFSLREETTQKTISHYFVTYVHCSYSVSYTHLTLPTIYSV